MKNDTNISGLSNDELLLAFRSSGSTDYLRELYRRYIPLVYGLCLYFMINEAKAQDAVIDIYATLGEKVLKYPICNFNTWLYNVTRNYCLHLFEKNKELSFLPFVESVLENETLFVLTKKAKSDEEIQALNHWMNTLPDEQRTIIQYFFLDEKSYADIVELTGYSLLKVKSDIQIGKENLKVCLVRVLNKAK